MALLEELEGIVGGMVDRGRSETVAGLDRLIAAHPRDAAPVVAKTVVLAFGRHNLSEAMEAHSAAGRMLGRARIDMRRDPLGAFSKSLRDYISAEFAFVEATRRTADRSGPLSRRTEAELASRQAMSQMAATLRPLNNSALVRVTFAAARALSHAVSPNSAEHRSAISTLTRMRGDARVGNLAFISEVYAHRRMGNYHAAIRVGRLLERNLPNSSVVKRAVGTAFLRVGDTRNAGRYMEAAVNLAPNDGMVLLDHARVRATAGDLTGARSLIERARSMDADSRMTSWIASMEASVAAATGNAHRFEPIRPTHR